MNTPEGSFFFYEGSLSDRHGVVVVVENQRNGRLRLQTVASQKGITDVGRTSIREATASEIEIAQSLWKLGQILDERAERLVIEEAKALADRQEKRRELYRLINAL